MNKISGVIIAKNEMGMIEDAIKSISFCNEVIIIDSGSTDGTKEYAISVGAKVYEISSEDFSDFRNLGLEKSEYDWILYIDADERVDKELEESIKKEISQDLEYSAYYIKRKNYYLGKNQWPKIEKLERLFKKEKLKGWKGKLHENPVIEGKVGVLNGNLLHFTHRDLESMLDKTIEWSSKEALLRYNANHPRMSWWRFPRVMTTAFLNSYVKEQGFKAGTVGIIESIYQSFSMFITYAKLWELQNKVRIKELKK